MMPNLLQYPIALIGALRAGLTVVNVNPLYTAPELRFQLEDSGAAAIVVLLMWFLMSSYAVLIGAEINAELERRVGTAG